jgi:PIN like domain
MPPSLDALRFVLDENLLRLGKALGLLRHDLACVGQPPVADLLPPGIGDSEWIPRVGQRGWVMITDDRRLRTRPAEAQLAIEHQLKIVHLHNAGHLSSWDQAVRLMSRWPGIEQQVEATATGPWWLSVRAHGVLLLTFQPGRPER